MWTKKFLPFLLLLVSLLGCGSETPGTSKREKPPLFKKRINWLVSHEDAVAQSKESGKPIFAFFTGSDWCRYCSLLDHQVLNTPAFAKWSKENVVLLELDFPRDTTLAPELKKQNEALKERYGVTGFPTVLFLTPEGQPVLKAGYQQVPAEQWIKVVDQKLQEALASLQARKTQK